MARYREKKSTKTIRKVVDDTLTIRTKSGRKAVIREEVWVNSKSEIVRYNLAYIDLHLCHKDNGRVLGYDNAHDHHERHYMGTAEPQSFSTYTALTETFYEEIQQLRQDS